METVLVAARPSDRYVADGLNAINVPASACYSLRLPEPVRPSGAGGPISAIIVSQETNNGSNTNFEKKAPIITKSLRAGTPVETVINSSLPMNRTPRTVPRRSETVRTCRTEDVAGFSTAPGIPND